MHKPSCHRLHRRQYTGHVTDTGINLTARDRQVINVVALITIPKRCQSTRSILFPRNILLRIRSECRLSPAAMKLSSFQAWLRQSLRLRIPLCVSSQKQ